MTPCPPPSLDFGSSHTLIFINLAFCPGKLNQGQAFTSPYKAYESLIPKRIAPPGRKKKKRDERFGFAELRRKRERDKGRSGA